MGHNGETALRVCVPASVVSVLIDLSYCNMLKKLFEAEH